MPVIAFEPNPVVADLYIKNMEINRFENVRLIRKALSNNENHKIDFFISDRSGSFRSSIFEERAGKSKISVETIKLSTIINSLDKVDLLKIDVEGAESVIIDDLIASNVLNKVNNLVVEFHHNPLNPLASISKLFNLLEKNGFKFNIKSFHLDFPVFQDVIIKATR